MSELQPGTTMYRIGELERVTRDLRQDVRELRGLLELAEGRIRTLEGQTPQARQLALEAGLAAARLAESGYDRHGRDCQCPYCATDEPGDDDTLTCSTCGAWIGMFTGRAGWQHYRGNPLEIYDAGHEATFAAGQGGAS